MSLNTALQERRRHPRIDVDIPALIRFTDNGIKEECVATLLNLSARGCFLALDRPLPEHTMVFIVTRVVNNKHPVIRGPRLALRGIVVRVSCDYEPPGVGLRLTSHRFLAPDLQKTF